MERRLAHEFRVSGRTLTGAAMVYGDTSPDFNERFLPGAFGEVRTVPINLQHDSSIVLVRDAQLTDSPRELRVRADLRPGSAALDLVRRGALNGFSIEFHAKAERRDAGVRVVERAELTGLALVDRGAYPGATVEVRARSGRTVRQRIPSGRNLGCQCSGDDCSFARFELPELGEMIGRAFYEGWTRAMLAPRMYGKPIGALTAAQKADVAGHGPQGPGRRRRVDSGSEGRRRRDGSGHSRAAASPGGCRHLRHAVSFAVCRDLAGRDGG